MTIKSVGSRWYKFDFHTHTPASSDHKNAGETETDWLRALMEAEVDCVAITDHVSGSWINRIKATYAELDIAESWYRPLHIFPGSEITITTGQSRVHILAVFDPSCNEATVTGVLGQCGIVQGHGDAEFTSSTKSIDDVIEIIQRAGGVAIPAHIDGPKGLLHNIQNSNQEIERWLKKIEAVECVNLDFLNGVSEELKKACAHLALVRGSDAHKSEDLGGRASWIKMSKPSIEGLKLALHDDTFCVVNGDENPNTLPNLYLEDLSIESMNYCGRVPGKPAKFQLHPLFNAVIGGRGTGKSTFIESIRLALGRDSEISELTHIHDEIQSFKKGVTNSDTKISVTVNRREELYRSIWRHEEPVAIEKYSESEGAWSVDNGDPKDRFHVSIYSQKQINALASNANSLLDIIDHSDQVNVAQWRGDYNEEKNRYLSHERDIRQLENEIKNATHLQAQLYDVNSDIESFEKGGHKNVFNDYQKLVSARQSIEEAGNVDALVDSLLGVESIACHDLSFFGDKELPEDLKQVKDIHGIFIAEVEKIKLEAAGLREKLVGIVKARKESIDDSAWSKNAEDIEGRYHEVVSEYKNRGEEFDPAQYEMWLQTRNRIKEKLGRIEELKDRLEEKKKLSRKSLKNVFVLRRRLQIKRARFIKEVIGDNPYVRMKLLPFSNTKTIEESFRKAIGVEKGFSSSIYQEGQENSLLHKLVEAPKDLSLKNKVKLLDDLKKTVIGFSMGLDIPGVRLDRRLANSLEDKAENQPELFDRFTIWWPDDLLVVEYAKDIEKGKFENIEKGSAGQKAAAILAFLLSHGENPIIVDQPEDDLDNALIYQLIVSQIHQNKKRRQIIMVTHNPNIVVNGDAEYVNV
ncbi:hypothetical protein AUP74_02436 [Microbulbifer aggregans]|uniref:Rad50/SbcC-type AAA domain-containing protein n=1 Tax=Microbulbifer aggregans TaxID=1769779 RepID=A0A1C9W9K2_9GAMM|nr:hypothetical protein [Microbulbifer aggregans]AOS97838.1 hypothetical protein AUP74_02436 [Microbulbifer aggregans]